MPGLSLIFEFSQSFAHMIATITSLHGLKRLLYGKQNRWLLASGGVSAGRS